MIAWKWARLICSLSFVASIVFLFAFIWTGDIRFIYSLSVTGSVAFISVWPWVFMAGEDDGT